MKSYEEDFENLAKETGFEKEAERLEDIKEK